MGDENEESVSDMDGHQTLIDVWMTLNSRDLTADEGVRKKIWKMQAGEEGVRDKGRCKGSAGRAAVEVDS